MTKDKPNPKAAIVFDDLVQRGGAERLLHGVCELYPKAPVYTSLATSHWINKCKKRGTNLHLSFMQRLPLKERLNRLYSIFGLHILAFESFDFSRFDLVLSISARYSHGVITKPSTKHVCYLNSPGRMFWDSNDYFRQERFFVRFLKIFINPFLSHVRNWDHTASQRVDGFIANSNEVRSRIKKYYNRDSTVIHPFADFPVELDLPKRISHKDREKCKKEGYFVVLTRLLPWKRVDLAIEACVKKGYGLKIVGEGPARMDLQKRASDYRNIDILGHVSEDIKWRLLKKSNGLIMTQKEDFGIAPLEAMYAGRPVIAFSCGGVLDTVVSGVTGEFFSEQTAASLGDLLGSFDPANYDPKECQEQAKKFSRERFVRELKNYLDNV